MPLMFAIQSPVEIKLVEPVADLCYHSVFHAKTTGYLLHVQIGENLRSFKTTLRQRQKLQKDAHQGVLISYRDIGNIPRNERLAFIGSLVKYRLYIGCIFTDFRNQHQYIFRFQVRVAQIVQQGVMQYLALPHWAVTDMYLQ